MRLFISVGMLVNIFFISPTLAEEPVYFSDENLKAAIEAELGVSDPTPTEMLYLTELICNDCYIRGITGLEYATNLQKLDLQDNYIRNIESLSGLTDLTHLDLNNNYIGDISALSGLTKVTYLDLHDQHDQKLTDISVLSGMSDLEYLHIYRHHISDISVLSGLANLTDLDIHDNRLGNLSPLSGLQKICKLQLQDNQISDVSPLTALTSLKSLILRLNPLSPDACSIHIPQIKANNPGIIISHDCGPVATQTLTLSSTTGGHILNPGEGTFSYMTGSKVLLSAQALPGHVFVGWSGHITSNENPLYIDMTRDYTIQANFSILDVIHVDDNAPGDPGPGDTNVSDDLENGTSGRPYDSIQEAIEVAMDGASIIVSKGVYTEQIDFLGKHLRLMGTDPNDPNASFAVIKADGAGPVVSFQNGEDLNCRLQGFVVTHGRGWPASAIYCSNSSPMISNCLIVGNLLTDSNGGVVYCSGSSAVFNNCTISGNACGDSDACLYLVNSPVVLTNSILWNNAPNEIILEGNGTPVITYCNITGGTMLALPGVTPVEGYINVILAGNGNMDANPLFAEPGYWADANDPNSAAEPFDLNAVWVEGDYHLKSQTGRWDPLLQQWTLDNVTSPCIDAGDPNNSVGHEPLPNGGIVNMGAYGGSGQASKG